MAGNVKEILENEMTASSREMVPLASLMKRKSRNPRVAAHFLLLGDKEDDGVVR